MTDQESESARIRDRLQFKFSIWGMIFLTSFVAVVLAVPTFVLAPLVGVSLLVLMLFGFFFIDIVFFGVRRHWEIGVMRALRKLIVRGVAYSALILIVGTISLIARNEF